MTTEELLKPRYKVSQEGYPDMPFLKGQIITLDRKDIQTGQYYWQPPIGDSYYEPYFNRWPSIFKPLQWWEERKEEDMPEYVGYRSTQYAPEVILKVSKHFSDSFGNYNANGFYCYNHKYSCEMFHSYSKTRISNEEEYANYNNIYQ